MDHPFDPGVFQCLAERGHVIDGERIDQPSFVARAKLDQADALLVPVEAARFRIQRKDGFFAKDRHELRELSGIRNKREVIGQEGASMDKDPVQRAPKEIPLYGLSTVQR